MVYKNYINGKWIESRSGQTFQSINPATGELLGELTRSTSQDVDEAVTAARQAFDSWRKVPAPKRGEIFGPTTAIVTVGSLEEAIQVNNDTGYGLVASIYTADVNKAFQAMRDINVGIVYVNAGTIGAEIQLPFGGTRGTGNGHREGGQAALDVYTEWKTIYFDYSGRLQRAQIDV